MQTAGSGIGQTDSGQRELVNAFTWVKSVGLFTHMSTHTHTHIDHLQRLAGPLRAHLVRRKAAAHAAAAAAGRAAAIQTALRMRSPGGERMVRRIAAKVVPDHVAAATAAAAVLLHEDAVIDPS